MSDAIYGEILSRYINTLHPFDAELIRLWMMPGFSYQDAAEVTGISVTTLYDSVEKSISKLKKYVSRSAGNSAAKA